MMTRQLVRTNKRLLILFVFGIMTTIYSSAQKEDSKIYLLNLNERVGAGSITEAIYQAIDPRLIANKYGVLTKEKNGDVVKSFALFVYYRVFPAPAYDADYSPIKWDYYINDRYIYEAGRALVSAIMPQAIESIDFTPPNPDMPKTITIDPETSRIDSINKGIIRLYTRDISKSAINDKTTVYLLNDNKVITRKIFDALNPVYIRSLKRITNPEELADYGYKKKMEIVKIDLFESLEYLRSNDCPKCDVILVDNIQVDWKIYDALQWLNIKEIREITEDDKKTFAPYSKLFTKEKLGWRKQVTIITL